jgi:hypothetical protein
VAIAAVVEQELFLLFPPGFLSGRLPHGSPGGVPPAVLLTPGGSLLSGRFPFGVSDHEHKEISDA